MANLTEAELGAIMRGEVLRCARVNDALATTWEASAARLRREGSYQTLRLAVYSWPKRVTLVRPNYERAAKALDAAANGLRACSMMMRKGHDPLRMPGVSIVDTDPNTGGPVL